MDWGPLGLGYKAQMDAARRGWGTLAQRPPASFMNQWCRYFAWDVGVDFVSLGPVWVPITYAVQPTGQVLNLFQQTSVLNQMVIDGLLPPRNPFPPGPTPSLGGLPPGVPPVAPGGGGVVLVKTVDSITTSSGNPITSADTLLLVGDTASPGNNKVYGTDGSGNRGWQAAGTSASWINQTVTPSDVTSTSNVMANVTGLSFAINAHEVWTAEFNLLASGNTNGVVFQITGPASPTYVLITTFGNTTAAGSYSNDFQTAFSTPTQAYLTGGVFAGIIVVKLTVENGNNSGTIQLQFADAVNTQAVNVKRGSYVVARIKN